MKQYNRANSGSNFVALCYIHSIVYQCSLLNMYSILKHSILSMANVAMSCLVLCRNNFLVKWVAKGSLYCQIVNWNLLPNCKFITFAKLQIVSKIHLLLPNFLIVKVSLCTVLVAIILFMIILCTVNREIFMWKLFIW